jgi:hypothetical protein
MPGCGASKNGEQQMKQLDFNKAKTWSLGSLLDPQMPVRMFLAVVLGAFTGQAACGGSPYLPSVGPPMLRFEIITAPGPSTAINFTSSVVIENRVVVPLIAPPPNTNYIASTMVVGVSTAKITEDVPSVFSPVAVMPAATSDMVVMPQMLVDYLKPTVGGRFFVPISLGFIPPMSNVVEPSRAVYKSQ